MISIIARVIAGSFFRALFIILTRGVVLLGEFIVSLWFLKRKLNKCPGRSLTNFEKNCSLSVFNCPKQTYSYSSSTSIDAW